jgi:hypothetical protein
MNRNLKNLKNPLLDFSIVQRTKPDGVDQDLWNLLCLAADNTCFENVLGMINSSALRTKIRNHLAAHPINGWNANKKFIRACLKNSKLKQKIQHNQIRKTRYEQNFTTINLSGCGGVIDPGTRAGTRADDTAKP